MMICHEVTQFARPGHTRVFGLMSCGQAITVSNCPNLRWFFHVLFGHRTECAVRNHLAKHGLQDIVEKLNAQRKNEQQVWTNFPPPDKVPPKGEN